MVVHSIKAQNAATDSVTALLGEFGNLVFRTSGTIANPGAPAATLMLSKRAFQPSTNGEARANDIEFDRNAIGNDRPVATATLETFGGEIVIHFSVSKPGGSGEVGMDNGLVIESGDTVSCSELVYRALRR